MAARLVERNGAGAGRMHLLPEGVFRIGRAEGNDLVVVTSAQVSRYHAQVSWDGQQYRICDLGSKNGTFLNGRRLRGPERLLLGDVIELPGLQLIFQSDEETETATPAAGVRASGLTSREREVLLLLAEGQSSKEIAERLVLSVRTVENHLASLYAKLGAHGRTDAVATAFALGLLHPSRPRA